MQCLNKNIHGNAHLQRAWDKYGESNFKFEIIEECEPVVRFEREQFYLNTLNPFDENGYNIVRQISKKYMSDNYMIKKCIESTDPEDKRQYLRDLKYIYENY